MTIAPIAVKISLLSIDVWKNDFESLPHLCIKLLNIKQNMSHNWTPTLNPISVWVYHSKIMSLNYYWEKKSVFSAFFLLDLPWLSQLYCSDNSANALCKLDHVWLKWNWKTKSVMSKPTELSSIKETKISKSIFNSRVL